MHKNNVIITHGHLYLFWSTGVYYTAELAAKYNIILVVPEEYRNDDKFQGLCKHLQVSEIAYYAYSGLNPFQHFANCRLFKALLVKHKPAFVVQNDYIGLDNMYLFHWTKKLLPSCFKLVVLSSFPSNKNTKKFINILKEMSVNRYATRLKLPSFIIRPVRNLMIFVLSFWTNILIPIIALRERPYFPVSDYLNLDIIPSRPLYDFYFFYNSCEKDYMDSLFSEAEMFQNKPHQVISSPIIDIYDVNGFLYNVQEHDVVSIYPSLIGLRDFKEEERTLKKWIRALELLREQLPDYDFIIKFHPSREPHRVDIIKKYLKQNCSFLQIYDDTCAEELMLDSKVIVGDVSSTLWWSNFRGNKTIISLGMQDFSVSSNMTYYPDILYFENMDDLSKIDIPKLLSEQVKKTPRSSHPLLTDVMESL